MDPTAESEDYPTSSFSYFSDDSEDDYSEEEDQYSDPNIQIIANNLNSSKPPVHPKKKGRTSTKKQEIKKQGEECPNTTPPPPPTQRIIKVSKSDIEHLEMFKQNKRKRVKKATASHVENETNSIKVTDTTKETPIGVDSKESTPNVAPVEPQPPNQSQVRSECGLCPLRGVFCAPLIFVAFVATVLGGCGRFFVWIVGGDPEFLHLLDQKISQFYAWWKGFLRSLGRELYRSRVSSLAFMQVFIPTVVITSLLIQHLGPKEHTIKIDKIEFDRISQFVKAQDTTTAAHPQGQIDPLKETNKILNNHQRQQDLPPSVVEKEASSTKSVPLYDPTKTTLRQNAGDFSLVFANVSNLSVGDVYDSLHDSVNFPVFKFDRGLWNDYLYKIFENASVIELEEASVFIHVAYIKKTEDIIKNGYRKIALSKSTPKTSDKYLEIQFYTALSLTLGRTFITYVINAFVNTGSIVYMGVLLLFRSLDSLLSNVVGWF